MSFHKERYSSGILLTICLHVFTCGHAVAEMMPSGLPKEFETLWKGQEEIVEVRLYGRSLGLFTLKVTPDDITVLEPEKLLTAANIKKTYHTELLPLLKSPLARNGHRTCTTDDDSAECSFIRRSRFTVIYDESNGQLNIFPGKNTLGEHEEDDGYWLPTPDTSRSFIHSQALNLANSKNTRALSLTGAGALGVTANSYVIADWLLNWQHYENQAGNRAINTAVNNAYYRTDIARRYYLQTGRMDNSDLARADGGSFSFNLLPLPRIEGARAGTTQAYFRDRSKVVATPVTLLLSRFSRVEAWRDNQLLGTWYLDAGVQEMDTRNLPDGSYQLELRIFEQDQFIKTEYFPFTQNSLTEGERQWDLFLQGGRLQDPSDGQNRADTGKTIISEGIRIPLWRSLSAVQGASFYNSTGFYELGVKWSGALLSGTVSINASRLWGGAGSRGDSETLSWSRGFSVSLYHHRKMLNACKSSYVEGWGGCSETYSASVSAPLLGWQTSLGYSARRNEFRNATFYTSEVASQYAPAESRQGHSRGWQVNASRSLSYLDISLIPSVGIYRSHSVSNGRQRPTDAGMFANLSLSLNQPISPLDSHNIRAGYNLQRSQQGGNRDALWMDSQWTRQTEASYREIDTYLSGSNKGTEAVVKARDNNRFGDLNGSLSASQEKGGGDLYHSASLTWNSSLAVNNEGIFWGGAAHGVTRMAGSTIGVHSSESDIPVVSLRGGNGIKMALSGGQRAFIPLNALAPTGISIEGAEQGPVNVQLSGNGDNEVFLTPGHIYPRLITAESTLTWAGRALIAAHEPLAGAVILNTGRDEVGEDGGFSAEMPANEKTIYLMKNKRLYSCPVRALRRKASLVQVGEVICTEIDADLIPEEIVKRSGMPGLLAIR